MFRQREFVCMGAPRDVLAFRDDWMRYAKTMFDALCLPATLSSSNDPFFGRRDRAPSSPISLAVTLLTRNLPSLCGQLP